MDILYGFSTLFSDPLAVLFVILASFAGVIVGATPGLTSAAAIAMLVPVTFYMEPLHALAGLYVIGKAGRFGGSISAILFNTPGTAAAAATTVDGNAMSRKGMPGKALKTAAVASACGDLIGDMLLIFGAVWIAMLTRNFGPPEYFAVYFAAFLVISSVVGASIVKGLISTAAGIVAAMIGIDPMEGMPRLDFGILDFQSGLALVPLLIGVFVFSEILFQIERTIRERGTAKVISDLVPGGDRLAWPEFRQIMPVILRSSILGSAIGILPGLGSSVAAFAAYGEERRRAKNKDEWGTGVIAGIAAPESANNAVSGPSMIPLLALGVPGSTIAAILLGVFLIHGITVGPRIFDTSRDLVFGLFAAGLVGIGVYFVIGFFGGAAIGRIIARAPSRLIYPYIFLTCFISAYAARTNVFDVFVMCVAGLFGYLMRKQGYSMAAFIIAFVLAQGAERAFRQSLILTNDGWLIFFQRPVAVAFFALAILVLSGQLVQRYRIRAQGDPS
ncbi:MAG: tripartite tricarboxylate transporter permease [Albidovulum sp.]|nr:tripartite tricarboxylate transporter permease [Albidovulum sp.]